MPDQWLGPFTGVADERRRIYMAMVAAMDAGVGDVLDALDRHGVDDDTLVWFASDNGGQALADNSPLRAGNGTVYEGSIRVASAIRWPAGLAGNGRKVTGLVSYIDIFPTLRRVVGLGASGGPGEPLDGKDAVDLISGRAEPGSWRFFSYYERYGDEQLALIDSDWKLVRRGPPILGDNPADAPPAGHVSLRREPADERVELFNLAKDPLEKRNLSARERVRTEQMLALIREFRGIQTDGGVPPMTAPLPPGWKAPPGWRMAE